MTIDEAVKMVGTEFTYVFEDGDTVPAYVKWFDPETGRLTCYSLEPKTDSGHVFPPEKTDLPDGTFCVTIGRHFQESFETLEKIAKDGRFTIYGEPLGEFQGCVFD